MENFPPQVVSPQHHILKDPTIPLQPNMPNNKRRAKSPSNMKKRSLDRSLAPSNKQLSQRRDMPISLIPHIPSKVPNMSSEGALEKEMRDGFFIVTTQHAHQGTLKATLT